MTKYVIIETTDVASVDFSKVLETSADTLRYSLDGSKTFVKYIGNKPGFLYGKPTNTHSQILDILNDPDGEWSIESPF
tara:strand:+ start:1242 stop:1475 length:234 start_codon:yes stop_codon:yes gene_type:complete